MNEIAFFYEDIHYYWHGVVIAAALAVGLAIAFSAAKTLGVSRKPVLLTALLSLPSGVLLARLLYWWCASDKFEGMGIFSKLPYGGYALYGAMLGALLSAVLVGLFRRSETTIGALLDCIALGGGAAVSIGRLGAFFTAGEDLGQIVDNEKLQFFPYAVPDKASGQWLMAVFVFESLAAAIIAAILLGKCMRIERTGNRTHRDGDFGLLFLMYYGCAQALLESLRGDSLYFSFLGLVRMSQAVSAIIVVIVLVIFSVRVVKARSLSIWKCILIWVACLGLLVTAFLTELLLNAEILLRSYCIMGGCLLVTAILGTVLWRCSCPKPQEA